MGFMTSSLTFPDASRAVSIAIRPGQLVGFYRPSPRGCRLACQGIVESVKFSSVVVHCTDSPVIGLTPGTLLRLSAGELRAL